MANVMSCLLFRRSCSCSPCWRPRSPHRPTLRPPPSIRPRRHPHPPSHLYPSSPSIPTRPPSIRPPQRPLLHRHSQIQPRTTVRFGRYGRNPRSGRIDEVEIVGAEGEEEDGLVCRNVRFSLGTRIGHSYPRGLPDRPRRLPRIPVDLLPTCPSAPWTTSKRVRSDQSTR